MTDHDFELDEEQWDLDDRISKLFSHQNEICSQTLSGVEKRLRTRSGAGTLSDLLSVGLETIGLLLNDNDRSADKNYRGR
ncbi:MAG: hypothetical protein KDB26_07815 [Microthrixaceae bacterium]|nr:hypothetical protein [Microthrixaceae bacterium]